MSGEGLLPLVSIPFPRCLSGRSFCLLGRAGHVSSCGQRPRRPTQVGLFISRCPSSEMSLLSRRAQTFAGSTGQNMLTASGSSGLWNGISLTIAVGASSVLVGLAHA